MSLIGINGHKCKLGMIVLQNVGSVESATVDKTFVTYTTENLNVGCTACNNARNELEMLRSQRKNPKC